MKKFKPKFKKGDEFTCSWNEGRTFRVIDIEPEGYVAEEVGAKDDVHWTWTFQDEPGLTLVK